MHAAHLWELVRERTLYGADSEVLPSTGHVCHGRQAEPASNDIVADDERAGQALGSAATRLDAYIQPNNGPIATRFPSTDFTPSSYIRLPLVPQGRLTTGSRNQPSLRENALGRGRSSVAAQPAAEAADDSQPTTAGSRCTEQVNRAMTGVNRREQACPGMTTQRCLDAKTSRPFRGLLLTLFIHPISCDCCSLRTTRGCARMTRQDLNTEVYVERALQQSNSGLTHARARAKPLGHKQPNIYFYPGSTNKMQARPCCAFVPPPALFTPSVCSSLGRTRTAKHPLSSSSSLPLAAISSYRILRPHAHVRAAPAPRCMLRRTLKPAPSRGMFTRRCRSDAS
jgi:hypothetical protein